MNAQQIQFLNTITLGSPGSGKSVSGAVSAVNFPGAAYVTDPHTRSLAQLVLEHAQGNVLFDQLSDLKHPLPLDILKPHNSPDPVEVAAKNHRSAQFFTEILMRRRTADIANMPLLEEWLSSLLLMFLFQRRRKSLRLLPYGVMPETKEFDSLVSDCTLDDIQAKFRGLKKLNPRALRAEVGSMARLVNTTFRAPQFLIRCDGEFNLDAFVKAKGKLIVEKGDDVDDDATTTILSARTLNFIDYAKSRPTPDPPIRVILEEATNAKTAGRIEEKAAGETRKYGLSWHVICQYPNFPGGTDGYFQNFPRKEIFRTADRDLARKMASIVASENPDPEETRSNQIESLTTEIMTLRPGWRIVTGPGGSRFPEYVIPLKSPWPDWPGLREAKLQEKLNWIYSRKEYQKHEDPPSSNSSRTELPPQTNSPESSSPAERWKRRGKKPTDGSASNESENESASGE
jgi:hypothetical protein